jgi:putative transcriptional regulator
MINLFYFLHIIFYMRNMVKVFRAMHNMSQEDLAFKLGVSRQTVLNIEKGKTVPSVDIALKIAKFFEVRVEEVFVD